MARVDSLYTRDWYTPQGFFQAFALVLLASLFLAIITNQYVWAGLPAAVLLAYLCIVDFRKVFFLLLISLPLSFDITLSSGFSTDLPTEPLMILLTGVFVVFSIRHSGALSGRFFRHPISILLLLHLGWILVTTVTSQSFFVSVKFLLAKLWYVATFYYLAGRILKSERDVRTLVWCVLLPMIFVILTILYRHAGYGFSFEDVNRVLSPFYSNHVLYACIIVLFVPYVWFARSWYPRWSWKWLFLLACIPFLLLAIQMSYTRAAYIGLVLAMVSYFVIRFRLMKVLIALSCVAIIGALLFITHNNRYLELAPDYEKTITHTDFDNLVEATYKGQDISTMERVYRWVAGFRMLGEKPLLGFGPGNFYFFYRSYTVTSFETYVSDNPERSGIHSYYLMLTVEQGILGGLLFLLFSFYVLIKGEQIYHQTPDAGRKRLVMMALLSIIIIDSLLIINDLVESDKVGPFYFMSMALLVNIDLKNKRHHT